MMDDRPNTSIWGTILSIAEIGLNIYQVVALNGKGLMMPLDQAEDVLGEKAFFQGKAKDGYLHFEESSKGERAATCELMKRGLITDPDVAASYGPPEEAERDGKLFHPDYFDELPAPEDAPWGKVADQTPIDNGVFFVPTAEGLALAVHKQVAEYSLTDYAKQTYSSGEAGDYLYYRLSDHAAIALFELSFDHPKVMEQITSWESLQQTLASNYIVYTAHWNEIAFPEDMILDVPAPPNMFLQHQLDAAAQEPPAPEPEQEDDEQFFEGGSPFDDEDIFERSMEP